jgi:hypothetical protein
MFHILNIKKTKLFIVFLGAVLFCMPAQSQKAPPNLQAALLMKLLAFYTNLGADPFTIHVVGAPAVASELKKFVGKNAGKATLNGVTEGDAPPAGPKVIYVGKNVPDLISHTQSNQVLSVTGDPAFVPQGVTLGISVEGKKPKILLNLTSSKNEGINWNPAILKVAATIK